MIPLLRCHFGQRNEMRINGEASTNARTRPDFPARKLVGPWHLVRRDIKQDLTWMSEWEYPSRCRYPNALLCVLPCQSTFGRQGWTTANHKQAKTRYSRRHHNSHMGSRLLWLNLFFSFSLLRYSLSAVRNPTCSLGRGCRIGSLAAAIWGRGHTAGSGIFRGMHKKRSHVQTLIKWGMGHTYVPTWSTLKGHSESWSTYSMQCPLSGSKTPKLDKSFYITEVAGSNRHWSTAGLLTFMSI